MSFELNIDSPIVSLIRRADNFCFVYIFPILMCLQHGTVPPIAALRDIYIYSLKYW
jgi:hypothetical protein